MKNARILILTPLLLLAPLSGVAQTIVQYWDGTQTTPNDMIEGGDGDWDTTTENWTNADGSENDSWQGQKAVFTTIPGTVSLLEDVAFTALEFRENYTIESAESALNASGDTDINVVGGETIAEISASITGAGAVNKTGAGTLIFSGTNDYTGDTDVSEGSLLVGDDALGSGTLRLHNNTTFGAYDDGALITNNVSILGNIHLVPGDCGCGLEFDGAISLGNATRTITTEAGDVYFNGPISGTGGLTLKAVDPEEAYFTFYGSDANTYTGLTTVDSGVALFLEKDPGVNAIAGNLLVKEGGAAILYNDDQIADTSTVQIDGYLDLGYSEHEKIKALNGSGTILSGDVDHILEVESGFFNGTIDEDCGCFTISLTKSGTGTFTLANGNNYSGFTVVQGGTLVAAADGAFGSSIVVAGNEGSTVKINKGVTLSNLTGLINGATLDNSGTLNGFTILPAVGGFLNAKIINRGTGVIQSTGLPAVVVAVGGSITNEGLIKTTGDVGDVIDGFEDLLEALSGGFGVGNPTDLLELLAEIDPDDLADLDLSDLDLGALDLGDIDLEDPEDVEALLELRLPAIFGVKDTTIINTGRIEGGDYAIIAIGGANLTNGGTIVGSVKLGTFANTVTLLTGGVIQGDLEMGNNTKNKFRLGGSGTQLLSKAVTGDITGYIGITEKIGSGTWIVDENNALATGLLISKGRLQIGNGGNVGSVESKIVNNGELAFNRAGTYTYGKVVTGTGKFVQAGNGKLILTNKNTTTGGALVEKGTLQMGNGGNSGSFLGDVKVNNNATFAIHRAGKLNFKQSISGAGNFRKMGGNKLTLSGTNTYKGRTYIEGGRLVVSTRSLPITSNVSNNGTLEFNQKFDGAYKGNISGGDLTKTGVGKVNLTGTSTGLDDTRIKQGTLSVNGILKSEDIIIEEKGTLAGSGKIVGDVTNHGTLTPGNSPGRLVINGDLKLTGSSEVDVEIAGSKKSQFDQIKVNGTARLNGALRVFLLGRFIPGAGDVFTILEANKIKGRFAETELPATLPMDVVYNADSVDLVVTDDARLPYQTFARGSNQFNVAYALERLRTRDLGRGGDFDNQVRPVLDALPADALRAAFEAELPSQSVAFSDSAFSRSRVFLPQMQTRLADIRAGARGFQASGMRITEQGASDMKDVLAPVVENKWGVWVDGSGVFNQVANFDNLGQGQGTSAAATVGVDYRLSDKFTVGFYTGYVGSWTDFGGGSEVDSNGSRFGIYSTYQSGGFYLNNVIGGEWNAYDWERRISFPGISRRATADTNGTVFETMFGGGYDWDITNNFKVGLFSSLEYTLLFVDGFTESGAGSLNLRVNDQSADSLRTNVGAQAMWTLPIGTRTLRPSLRAAWRHEYLDGSRRISSALAGGAGPGFSTRLPGGNRRDSLLLNGGFSMDLTDNVTGYLYYTGDLAGGTTENVHAVNAGLRLAF